MQNPSQETQDAIEAFVDSYGIQDVVNMIANVCWEKAIHLRTNWQDDATAKVWDKLGSKLDSVAGSDPADLLSA